MLEDLDLHSIADEQARELVRQLLNLLEDVRTDLRAALAENQRLRDEINRLKGEQGTRPSDPLRSPRRIMPRNANAVRRKPGRRPARAARSRLTANRW